MVEAPFSNATSEDPSPVAYVDLIEDELHIDAEWCIVLHEVKALIEDDEPERFKIVAQFVVLFLRRE